MKFGANTGSALGKHFISLKDGEQVIGLLSGEPFEFRTHWVDKRSDVCVGTGCAHCDAGVKSSFRFRMNLLVSGEDKKPVAKILEQGSKLYNALKELNEEVPLEENYIKVKRAGSGQFDTEYSVTPVLKQKVTAETKRILSDIKLLPLNPNDDFWKGSTGETTEDDSAVPF